MSTRVALFLSVILAGAAVVGVRAYINSYKLEQEMKHEKVPILVAKETIQAGTLLKEEMLGAKFADKSLITATMIHYDDRLLHLNRVLSRTIPAVEPILKTDLSMPADSQSATTSVVGPGKRAVTLQVDQVKGVAFLVRPGDYVDVLGTFDVQNDPKTGGVPSSEKRSETRCLLEGARVLAVDNRTEAVAGHKASPTTRPYRSITLEVDPVAGAKLVHAQSEGDLHLMLRPPSETGSKILGEGKAYRWDR